MSLAMMILLLFPKGIPFDRIASVYFMVLYSDKRLVYCNIWIFVHISYSSSLLPLSSLLWEFLRFLASCLLLVSMFILKNFLYVSLISLLQFSPFNSYIKIIQFQFLNVHFTFVSFVYDYRSKISLTSLIFVQA